MQDINDDMDDLFRKAAEQYPLKTDGADWQKIAAGLQGAAMPATEEKEKKKRRALWLFWLLPLVLVVGAVYYKSDNDKQLKQQVAATEKVADNGVHNDVVNNKAGDDVKSEASDNASQKRDEKVGGNSISERADTENTASRFSSADAENNIVSTTKEAGETLNGKEGNSIAKSSVEMHTKSGLNKHVATSSFTKNKKDDFTFKQGEITANKSETKGNEASVTNDKKNLSTLQPSASSNRIDTKDEQSSVDIKSEDIATNKTDSMAVNAVKKDSAANNTINNASNKNLVKAMPRKQTGFYAGLMASFDVSTIKLQRINKTGYGFELLLGYRFSNRLSVESGVNWTDKKYYSIGKYFDKTNTGISPDSKIINTSGTCAMFEIPVVMKYDFAQKKNSNFFATAGLSSYIMKDEKYTYYANHSGNYYTATKKYSNSGSNLFSVASLSIGYQLQLNKHLSLRAEPYIKMPLSGVGIAKMPITSTGISVGFTRSF